MSTYLSISLTVEGVLWKGRNLSPTDGASQAERTAAEQRRPAGSTPSRTTATAE